MFLNSSEKKISDEYLKKGYLISDIPNKKIFNKLDSLLKKNISRIIKKKENSIDDVFLNNFHKNFLIKDLNSLRVELIEKLLTEKEFRKTYYQISKE